MMADKKKILLKMIKRLYKSDPASAHSKLDELLLAYIDDIDISKAVDKLIKHMPWWAYA